MMRSEERLERLLAAWHEDSRRPPGEEARERMRTAMHQARRLGAAAPRRPLSGLLHPRFGLRRSVLAGVTVVATAAAVVGVLGWNAPPGSPLFQVRSVRQGIQLALAGSDAAALHLGFAETDLADARRGENTASSLQDASNELAAARAVLPPDRSSPLWHQYDDDIASLQADQEGIEGEGGSTPGASPIGGAAGSEREPEETAPPNLGTALPQGSHSATAPSVSGGGGDPEGSGDPKGSDAGGDR
jgi:hypothetical protein